MLARCPICDAPLSHVAGSSACPRCGGSLARTELLAPLRQGGFASEATVGFRMALRGVALTFSHGRLLACVIVPLILNVALFAALSAWLILHLSDWLPRFDTPWMTGLDWLRAFLNQSENLLGVLLAIAVAAVATLLASTALHAPFLEWTSEAVETIVIGKPDRRPITLEHVLKVWIWPVVQAIVLASIQAVVALLLFLASLTGVLAPLVLVGGAWLTAVSLADVVIARKRHRIADRFRRVNAAPAAWLALALPFSLVPFLLPLGIAGATLLELRAGFLRAGRADRRLR